jgi:uncharacterized membrane protein
MTRSGRYKAVGVAGVSITAMGMFLLSRMDVSTAYSTVVINMMVVGLGLGFTLPVFNLAVQNAVDMRQVGVATSSMQFLRSIGGSIGAAGFGAVMTSRFAAGISERLTADVTAGLPPGLSATLMNPQAMMNPQVAARIRAADPAVLARMQPLMNAVKGALSTSLHDVFLFATFIALAALVFALIVVDVPLRKSNRQMPATEAV